MKPSAESWSRAAALYDRQLVLERRALRAAADLAAPRRDERLLDVGTGTGALLRLLAERPDRPSHAVGVDSSPAMLAHARPLPLGWELADADAGALPFDDGSFEVATAAYLLHLLDHDSRQRVVGELARVLRAGGRLVTVTPTPPRSPFGRLLVAPLVALAERSSGVAAGLRPLDPRPDLQPGFAVRQTRFVHHGYPSLCVLAERRAPGRAA